MGKGRVRMPATARRGEVVEIRAQVEHPNDSGLRSDPMGRTIPRHVVERFTCTFEGEMVFEAHMHPAVSTNPFVQFSVRADRPGRYVFLWTDDQGGVARAEADLRVTD